MRKRLFLLLALFSVALLSCVHLDAPNDPDAIAACGCEQPEKELPWLKELIETAETDDSGDYSGSIWLEKYNGQDVFVTNMRMSDPLHVFRFFDCSGNNLSIEDSELLNMKFATEIFSNRPKKIEIPDIDNAITACNVHQPQKELPWLAAMIIKAEADMSGNYWGTIWLEKYKGQDIFVTNMMLGSGGIMYYFFDCSGNHLTSRSGEGYCPSNFVGNGHFFIEDIEDEIGFDAFIPNMKLDVVIYSTLR
jgi:hypothetical protein